MPKKWVLLSALCVGQAGAQQSGLDIGGVTAYPTLGVSAGYSDNVAVSAGPSEGAAFLVVSPAVRLETGNERSTWSLLGALDYGEYESSGLDDYIDLLLRGGWDYRPTIRSDFAVALEHEQGHNRRGEGLQEFIATQSLREVDEFHRNEASFQYRYGAPGARGRLGLSASYGELEYQNNRDLTAVADHTANRLGAVFAMQLAPKTNAEFIARYGRFDFDEDIRDNDELLLAAALVWEATAKTTGRIELGQQRKDFDNAAADFEGISWEARVEWQPKAYSTFELGTSRHADHAYGQSLFAVRRTHELAWRHQWRSRLSTTVDYAIANHDLNPGDREDQVVSIGASVSYQFRRWLLIGLGIKHYDRDSSDPLFDHERNEILISVEIAP